MCASSNQLCQQSRNIMASDEGSQSSFGCKWDGCMKSYGTMDSLRRHQRIQKHAEVDIGKLLCPIVECGRR